MQLKSFSTIPQKAVTVANVYILLCANQLYYVKKRLAQFILDIVWGKVLFQTRTTRGRFNTNCQRENKC